MSRCIKAGLALMVVAALGFVLVYPSAAGGKKEGPNFEKAPKDAKQTPAAKAVDDLALADQLIRYGRQEKNAESLLLAAQIIHKTPSEPLKVEHKATGGKEATAKAPKMKNSPKSLVAEAKKLSSSPQVEALAMATEKLIKESTRGAVGGARIDAFTIGPFQTINWNPIVFRANEQAVVHFSIGVYGRMTLEVIDENGIVVARDSVPGNFYRCVWYPRWTGPFRFRLTNNDTISFNCGMATN